jgi:hypothetical protein
MFDEAELENFRKVYNSQHSHETPIPPGASSWDMLKGRMQDKCKTGRGECIVAHLLQRPKAPDSWIANPEEWLSSIDIEKVEKQYMKLFPDYEFLGCIPIDFDLKSKTGKCLVNTLCSLDLKTLYVKGKHRIGIVFNTDLHTGPGKHWVALICDIRPELETPRVTYFDSYSNKPEKEIKVLMKRWKDQWESAGVHQNSMDMTYNTTRHQFADSECGMYCLYFHYACLTEVPMDERIPDKVVNTFRRLLFRTGK